MSLEGEKNGLDKGINNYNPVYLSKITGDVVDLIWHALNKIGKGTSEENYLVRKLVSDNR